MKLFVNGQPREVAERITVADLLADLDVEPRHVAVEVNQQLVPRGDHGQRQLAAGDHLEIVTLVGGGC
jgi:thiamine biosynthesis protein ThiS